MTIGGSAFGSCNQLPAIVLPKSLTVIGQSAFRNCYNLSAITSKATTPPVCGTGAWDGVAKDNFTVEVPEQSVVKYQTQNGWSDFRRIAAHRDFSISRPQLRLLNAQHSGCQVSAPTLLAVSSRLLVPESFIRTVSIFSMTERHKFTIK